MGLSLLHKERNSFAFSLNTICILLSVGYIITYTLLGIYDVAKYTSFILVIFLVNHFFKKNHLNLFKSVSLIGVTIGTFIFSQLLGKEANLHYIFIVNVIFPLIVFTRNQKAFINTFIILNISLFTLANFNFFYIPNNIIPEDQLELPKLIAPFTFLILILAPIKKLYDMSINLIERVVQDSDSLLKAHEELHTQKDILQGIIDSSKHNSIFAVDSSFNLINYNSAFEEWMLQTQNTKVEIGENYFEYLPKPKALLYKPLFKKALKGESFSKKVISKVNNEEVHTEMTFTPLVHFDDVVGVTIFSRDVTDSVKLEYTIQEKRVTEKSLQFRTDFLAQMSHEIRTPLNGIVGMADLISDSDNLTEKEKEQMKIITDSGNDLMHIINSVLDLSKLEAGQVQLSLDLRETNKLLNHTKDLYLPRAKEKGLSLNIEIDENLPGGVNIDGIRIHQILNNLTSNAIKFTQNGSVTLKLSASNKTEEKVDLKFEVIDTGNGISDNDQKRLFNKYVQLSSNIAKKADGATMGTGLGLTICQELVELMNGEIGVSSEIGKGTNFYFTIPNIEIKAFNEGETKVKTLIYDCFKGKHILVVEDKKVNQKVAQLILKSIGLTSETADNGEEAIMTFMKNPDKFDLILMDIQMPVMDGLTATAELKRNFPNCPPIIALSANNMVGSDEYCKKNNLDGYLSKPINGKILKEKLSEFFSNKEQISQ